MSDAPHPLLTATPLLDLRRPDIEALAIGLPIEELHAAIRDVPKPVIARVQGFAIGGGNPMHPRKPRIQPQPRRETKPGRGLAGRAGPQARPFARHEQSV